MKMLRLEYHLSYFFYIIHLLLRKVIHSIKYGQRVSQILWSIPSAIALGIFPHCYNDFICFANKFGSRSGWANMERTFSALHSPAVASKDSSETAKDMFRTAAADEDSIGIHVNADSVG